MHHPLDSTPGGWWASLSLFSVPFTGRGRGHPRVFEGIQEGRLDSCNYLVMGIEKKYKSTFYGWRNGNMMALLLAQGHEGGQLRGRAKIQVSPFLFSFSCSTGKSPPPTPQYRSFMSTTILSCKFPPWDSTTAFVLGKFVRKDLRILTSLSQGDRV